LGARVDELLSCHRAAAGARFRGVRQAELAETWRPYIESCIAAFGTRRCMFESNFPVDEASSSYRSLWNAFKRITTGCSKDEKRSLYHDVAQHFYRLCA
jgi:predicted TIM-barrel fold metal-dependent hydrolase